MPKLMPTDDYNAFNHFAHDLNNPLGTIKNSLQLIEIFGETNERQRESIERAIRSVERIETMVINLLEYARLGNDYVPVMGDCDLRVVLEDTIESIEALAEKHGIELVYDIPALPMIHGNSTLLHSLFLNLMTNAIKYNRAGGQARLVASDGGDEVIIRVEDNGIGIPPDEQERIYESFYRGDATHHENKIDGAGLGLSIVQHIVSLHSGRIEVESAVGIGTTFTVMLPRGTLAVTGVGEDDEA